MPVTAESTQGRLTSLDAFRGITIAGMILVNNPGSWSHVHPPLLHAEWNGWTPTDLIFPFFLFIMGVAMSFSIVARLQEGADRGAVFYRVLKRSLILIFLGLLLNGFPRFDLGEMRFPGVLQRIGLVYLLASVVVLKTGARGQAVTAVALLVVYWALMALVPVPGYGAGDLTPDGNLAAHIDRMLFGSHTWRDTWDPEGLLSTVPAVATTLSGVLTGRLLRSKQNPLAITCWMFVLGWGAILLGLVWGFVFPINKNLWTSSYVAFTSGAALQFLAVCYWLIDVQGWRKWAQPAIAFGMNAITVFVASGLLVKSLILIRIDTDGSETSAYNWIYQNVFVPWAGPLNGSLAFAVANILFWYIVMSFLYHRRIFIKI